MKQIFSALLACVLIFTALPAITSASVVSEAHKYKGIPYASGGTTSAGFDCSGFTQKAFSDAGSSIPRTTGAQFNSGTPVDKGNLQPGDLVFFNTSGNGVSHSGIYIGSSNFIHSSSSKGVMISSINDPYYWGSRYIGARRINGQVAVAAPAPAKVEKAAKPKVEVKPEPVKAKVVEKVEPVVEKVEVVAEVETEVKVEVEVAVAKKPVVEKVQKEEVIEVAKTPEINKEEKVVEVPEVEEVVQADFEHLHPTAISKRVVNLASEKNNFFPKKAI